MPFRIAHQISFFILHKAERPQCDTLIEFHAGSDLACRSDDYSRAVIDEERAIDGGTRMNVDSRAAMSPFGHHSRNQRNVEFEQFVRHAIDRDGRQSRIAENDFIKITSRRITIEGGLNVGRKSPAKSGNRLQKLKCLFLTNSFEVGLVLSRFRLVFAAVIMT